MGPRSGAFLVLAALTSCPGASADRVHLDNGEVVRGQVLSSSKDEVRVRLPFLTTTFPAGRVKRIEKEPLARMVIEIGRALIAGGQVAKAHRYFSAWLDMKHADVALRALAAGASDFVEARRHLDAGRHVEATAALRRSVASLGASPTLAKLADLIAEEHEYFAAHGYLPPPRRALEKGRVVIMHRHHGRARQFAARIAALLKAAPRHLAEPSRRTLPEKWKFTLFVEPTRALLSARCRLPEGIEGWMLSPTRAATHHGGDASLERLVHHAVAAALYPLAPPWLLEGLAAGAWRRTRPAERSRLGAAVTLKWLLEMRDAEEAGRRHREWAHGCRLFVEFLLSRGGTERLHTFVGRARSLMSREIRLYLKRIKRPPRDLRFSSLIGPHARRALLGVYSFRDEKGLEGAFSKFLAGK